MGFFDFFTNQSQPELKKFNQLFIELQNNFPDLSEKDLVVSSCIAGLLARIAYVDFHLDPEEIRKIDHLIQDWSFNPEIDSSVLANMAITHIKEMAGLENHLYVHPLNEYLSQEDKYRVLQSLFLVAASDGNVDTVESEEIRIITKGLNLSNQHFIAARAGVAKYLGALKR